jgi:hypothetical protein
MTTNKSYTDISQSKKLTEILPLDSADMKWFFWKEEIDAPKTPTFGYSKTAAESYKDTEAVYLPCWSLATLISIIPQEIFDGEYIINITEGCDNRWVLTYDHFENRNHSYYSLSTGADNLVDACYELILKLNKLNLL